MRPQPQNASVFERDPTCRIPTFNQPLPSPLCVAVFHTSTHNPNRLARRAPDRLEEAVLLCEPVEAVVGLAHGTNKAADGVDLVVTRVAAVLVNLANAQLDRGVVLGPDDASGGRLDGLALR